MYKIIREYDGEQEILIELSSVDILALNNDLLSVDDWVKNAIIGKINKCKKRMIYEWQPKLLTDPTITSLPATEEELIEMIVSLPDYKDRITRDSELQTENILLTEK